MQLHFPLRALRFAGGLWPPSKVLEGPYNTQIRGKTILLSPSPYQGLGADGADLRTGPGLVVLSYPKEAAPVGHAGGPGCSKVISVISLVLRITETPALAVLIY